MRADRLLTILLLLQNAGKLTTRQLAARLEVSERTILRDMEALSVAGVPVYAERGNRGGWRLSEGYRTDLSGMKPEELGSLLIATAPNVLRDLGIGNHFEAALQKLLASSTEAMRRSVDFVRNKIHIDGASWHDAQEAGPNLAKVQEAVMAERKLRIRYRRDGLSTERTVNPLGLVAKRSVWYLVAESEGEVRTYRLSRIEQADALDEPFTVPERFDLAAYWEESTAQFKRSLPRYPARIRVKRHVLLRLESERYMTVLHTVEREDDWIEAAVEFATLEHGREVMLGFAVSAEALEPPQLREAVIAAVRELAALYGL